MKIYADETILRVQAVQEVIPEITMCESAQIDTEEQGGNTLTAEEQFELLSVEERREAVKCLEDHSSANTLTDLATKVAERLAEQDSPDRKSINRLETELHHWHLPKLEDFGVIEYDRSSHHIKYQPGLFSVER